jgi:hypothetical protein
MSILQDYKMIRQQIGENKYCQVCEFLKHHPHYLLSDVYYRESVWNEMEAWVKANIQS